MSMMPKESWATFFQCWVNGVAKLELTKIKKFYNECPSGILAPIDVAACRINNMALRDRAVPQYTLHQCLEKFALAFRAPPKMQTGFFMLECWCVEWPQVRVTKHELALVPLSASIWFGVGRS